MPIEFLDLPPCPLRYTRVSHHRQHSLVHLFDDVRVRRLQEKVLKARITDVLLEPRTKDFLPNHVGIHTVRNHSPPQ